MFITIFLLAGAASVNAAENQLEKLFHLCQADDESACEKLSNMCDKNNAGACLAYGSVRFQADQFGESLPAFQKSCKLGLQQGCHAYTELKSLLKRKQEVEEDRARAIESANQARQSEAQQRSSNMLQGIANQWIQQPQQPQQPQQTNCVTTPVYEFGRIVNYRTNCQ